MKALVSCVATSLVQAETILAGFELLGIESEAISCLIPERGMDEDEILGRLQFEYVAIPNLGHFLAAGPIGKALQAWPKPGLEAVLSEFGQPDDLAEAYAAILEDRHIFIAARCDGTMAANRASSFLRSAKASEVTVAALPEHHWEAYQGAFGG